MSKQSVLISGAGIAGPVCAYFLSQAGIRTTIIERAPELRKAGQQIDIRGAGIQIIKKMGVEEAIRAKTTKEAGLAFVDSNGKTCGEFPVDQEGGRSFTSEIEILRGELAQIFYDATKEETEYIFGDHVTAILDDGNKASVTLASGTKREFDMVIGADGMGSKIRRVAFSEIEDPVKSLDQWAAFFTIPYKESDGTFAKWYNAPGGRSILLRPDNAGYTRAYLSIMSSAPAETEGRDITAQKKQMRELFSDAGWESLRVLDGMEDADDFYMQQIAQVKMPKWSKGRVAVIGDAGYCPSPISGMGTTLAIIGAYILAGEIGASNGNHEAAFAGYEKKMQPYVSKAQSLPPGAPGIINPQTKWGISILHTVTGFVSWSRLPQLLSKFSSPPAEDKSLPTYSL
jgi:2-polyprenyl-6-methoxyphenol hydroxylase-like FAD-dependent oxidoreductase